MGGFHVRYKSMSVVVAAAVLVAIGVSLTGCGGGGGDGGDSDRPTTKTITTTTTPDCNTIGGPQCTVCNSTACHECATGYGFNPDGSEPNQCIAECVFSSSDPELPAEPAEPTTYNGKAWPTMCIKASQPEYRFLGIGDWGGVKKTGQTDSIFGDGLDAWVWNHTWKVGRRGYVEPADKWAQVFVSRNMQKVAKHDKVDFVINAGDNFYPGGIERECGSGTSKDTAKNDATGQFNQLFHMVYGDVGKIPWFSVLGNHDLGGMGYDAAWDSQIFRTWFQPEGASPGSRWRMPAMFWSQRVQYRQFASVFFMMDSNKLDAFPWEPDPNNPGQQRVTDHNHNVCQNTCVEWHGCCEPHQCHKRRDPEVQDCWGIRATTCWKWFHDRWVEGVEMLKEGVSKAPADWHFVVTHFPGPAIIGDPTFIDVHNKYGIDLVFTGHTHHQVMHLEDKIPYVISGGGGGISSDQRPTMNGQDEAYGFVEFALTRDALTVRMHSWGGPDPGELIVRKTATLKPAPRSGSAEDHQMAVLQRLRDNPPDDYERRTASMRYEQHALWSHANIGEDRAFISKYV